MLRQVLADHQFGKWHHTRNLVCEEFVDWVQRIPRAQHRIVTEFIPHFDRYSVPSAICHPALIDRVIIQLYSYILQLQHCLHINSASNLLMMKINQQLSKKIEEILVAHPKADEDCIVDKISNSNSLRMKKQAIKAGVRQYFKAKVVRLDSNKKQPLTNVDQIDKPKKKVKKGQIEIQFDDNPSFMFENLGGVQQTIEQIKNHIFLPIQRQQQVQLCKFPITRGFLLAGPVGCGKTFLANCVVSHMKNVFNFHAYSVPSGLLTHSDSEESIKKIFLAAKQNQPSIIFIDDIDYICNKQVNKRSQVSPMIILLAQLDKIKQDNIYIISTTSNPEKMDICLRKLNNFEKIITLNMSSDECREKVLKKIIKDIKNNLTNQQIIDISKSTSGFMASDLVMLIKEASLCSLMQQKEQVILTADNVKKSIKFVQPILKKEGFTDIPTTTLDDVGGLQHLKRELQRQIIIPMRQQSKFKEMNFEIQSGGVLLYGPPGCGKTMLAKAIANAVRANFIIVKGPQLLNKYVGQSEQAVREVFGRAQRASPCVIFFDQFDALAPKRSDQGNQVTERVVNTLLTALDGVQQRKMVFVIAATNRKDMIDQATLRAGRIQKHLYVPQPNEDQRIDILKAITKNMKLSKTVTFNDIAKKTKGFSGADLKFLVKEATVTAVMDNRNEVLIEDLDKSLTTLLEARRNDELKSKVHQIELKDAEQNQHFTFHHSPEKMKAQVAIQKQIKKDSKNVIIQQFIEYLGKKFNNS